MGRFAALLRKEWRQALPMTALMVLAAVLILVLLRFSPGIAEPLSVRVEQEGVEVMLEADDSHPFSRVIAAMLIPFLLFWLPGWAAWQGYQGFRQEWSNSQSHLLLSLPVSGWHIVAAKQLVAWAGILIYGVIAGAAIVPLAKTLGLVGTESLALSSAQLAQWGITYTHMAAAVIAYALAGSMGLVLLSQWTWVVGRAAGRWEWLSSLAAMVTGFWFVLRAGIWGGEFLGPKIPAITLLKLPPSASPTAGGGLELLVPVVSGNAGVIIGMGAAALILYAATSLLLEHVLEV